jgi:CRP/FNR family cyclic AMP-dependent transcriptional regulator
MEAAMTREAMRSLPLFQGLARDDVEVLARSFRRESLPAGAAIFGQGDRAEKLYVLISGRVAIRFKPYDGDILPVTEVGPGGVFGWSAALNRPCYTSCAVALGDGEAISISGEELRRLCKAYPRTGVVILERLAGVIAERVNSTHAKVVDMLQQGMQSVTNR